MLNSAEWNEELDMHERRSSPRRSIVVRADVEIPGKKRLSAHAVDLSKGGLGLQCPEAIAVGEEVHVTVPLEVCGDTQTVKMTGRVCYCTKQTEHHYRLGLQFVHLDAETERFIAAVCG